MRVAMMREFRWSSGTIVRTMRYGKTIWLFVTRGNENVKITKEEGNVFRRAKRSWPERNDFEELSSCRTRNSKINEDHEERERKKERRTVSTLTSRKRGTVQFSAREWSDGTRETSNVSRFLAERFVANEHNELLPPPLSNNYHVKNNISRKGN